MKVTNRIWGAGCAAAVVLLAAGGYFLGVQPQLAHAAEATSAAESTEAQASTIQAKIAALSKAAASQGELEAKAAILDKAVPPALQANTFIRRINAVAALDAVGVQSIVVGSATAYTVPQGAVAAAPVAPTATPAPSASASAAVAPAAPAVSAAPVLAATDPSVTGQDFTVIPITVVVDGTGDAGLQFVKDLQRDERLFLISDYALSVDPDDASKVTTTLTGSIYALKV